MPYRKLEQCRLALIFAQNIHWPYANLHPNSVRARLLRPPLLWTNKSERPLKPLSSIIVFAFFLGVTLSFAATCSVAAAKRLVLARRSDWLIGIMVAVSWAAVTVAALQVVFGAGVRLQTAVEINTLLIVASVVMGIGAYINGSCFVGSIGRLSTGEITCLMTFAGLVAARWVVELPFVARTIEQSQVPLGTTLRPTFWWLASAAFLAGFGYGTYRMFVRRKRAVIALSLMGVFAALVFAINPGWTYEAWVGQIVHGHGFSRGFEIELTIGAMFLGAMLGALYNGHFVFRPPRIQDVTRCFGGGFLMGLGARFVPGGNDTLLLWTMPNYALYGFVSYAVMIATIMVLLWGQCILQNRTKIG